MKKDEKKLSECFSRVYVNWLIRQWRSMLYTQCSAKGEKMLTDSQLAKLVCVTSATFSRLSTGVVTCSFPVVNRILRAISITLCQSDMVIIHNNAYSMALKVVYQDESGICYGNA